MHAAWSDTATDADGHFAIKAHKDENVVFWIVFKETHAPRQNTYNAYEP